MATIKNKYSLDSFQLEACDYMDNGFHVLVSAPTGSGKTAIAEYAIEQTKKKDNSVQIIYTCPIKSLCNEKYRDMVNYHQSISSGYSIGLMTGDIIINPTGDIIIMTTEVLYNLSTNKEKEVEFNPGCVIFDEVHYINDDGRGHIWEKCIIYSLKKYSALLVLLSATIGNIDSLMTWLNSINSTKQFKKIVKTERPVPLR
jgi:ATP-dependent RNA helicase HelY